MKLNYRQTVKIGFAFLAICAFWQMYDGVIPLILTKTFHMNETISGAIMAADNVLALFLLPLFGGISDRCTAKMGKRKPFIIFGTLAAVIFMLIIPIMDNIYFANPVMLTKILFVVVLGCLLVAMGTYRSPAVALMPDVTPKPLRSKANAVINLMGAVGGILYLIITSIMYSESRTKGLEHVNYIPLFIVVAAIMIISLLILIFAVDEAKLTDKMKELEAEYPEDNAVKADETEEKTELPRDVKKSLLFLLLSIALWFIGYNAVATWFTTFAGTMWNMSLGSASQCLTIATAGAIVSYIPVGHVAGRIGRRKTIMGGVVILAACFLIGFFYTFFFDAFNPVLYAVFLLIGLAWAAINVNSLPMVLEMCKGSDVGRFTGYYYTFSMFAQIITPIAAGFLMRKIGYNVLFIYAAIFVFGSFITMCMVKHGDSKIIVRKGLEAYDVED